MSGWWRWILSAALLIANGAPAAAQQSRAAEPTAGVPIRAAPGVAPLPALDLSLETHAAIEAPPAAAAPEAAPSPLGETAFGAAAAVPPPALARAPMQDRSTRESAPENSDSPDRDPGRAFFDGARDAGVTSAPALTAAVPSFRDRETLEPASPVSAHRAVQAPPFPARVVALQRASRVNGLRTLLAASALIALSSGLVFLAALALIGRRKIKREDERWFESGIRPRTKLTAEAQRDLERRVTREVWEVVAAAGMQEQYRRLELRVTNEYGRSNITISTFHNWGDPILTLTVGDAWSQASDKALRGALAHEMGHVYLWDLPVGKGPRFLNRTVGFLPKLALAAAASSASIYAGHAMLGLQLPAWTQVFLGLHFGVWQPILGLAAAALSYAGVAALALGDRQEEFLADFYSAWLVGRDQILDVFAFWERLRGPAPRGRPLDDHPSDRARVRFLLGREELD